MNSNFEQLRDGLFNQVIKDKKNIFFCQDFLNVMALKCKIAIPSDLAKYVNDPTKYKNNDELSSVLSKDNVGKVLPYYLEKCIKNEVDLLSQKYHATDSEKVGLENAVTNIFNIFNPTKADESELFASAQESKKEIERFITQNRMKKYWGEEMTAKFFSTPDKDIKNFALENNLSPELESKLSHNYTRFHELLKFENSDELVANINQQIVQQFHSDLADDYRTITMTPEYICDGHEVFFRGITLPKNLKLEDWLSQNHIAKGTYSRSEWLDYFINNRHVGVIYDIENGATSVTNRISTALGFGSGFSREMAGYILEIRPKAGTALTTAIGTGQMGLKASENEIFFDQISNRDVKIYKLGEMVNWYYDKISVVNVEKINNPYYIKRDGDDKYGLIEIAKDNVDIYSTKILDPYKNIDIDDYRYSLDYNQSDMKSLVTYQDVLFNRVIKGDELSFHIDGENELLQPAALEFGC